MHGRGMRRRLSGVLGVLALVLPAAPVAAQASGPVSLTHFESAAELAAFLAARAGQEPSQPTVPYCPPDQPCAEDMIDEVVVTGSRITTPATITNNQQAGVDEGDVVKARGDTLVILRRGRLFTVSTAGGGLRPVDSINAYPPGISPEDDWYDEMLVSGDRVIVIGYSYERGGTEINRFRMDAAGRLTFEDSHHLTSEDYYSSRNYASRLIGEQLIVYSPLELEDGRDPLEQLPTLTTWRPGDEDEGEASGIRIVAPEDVHIAPHLAADPKKRPEAIHTVIRCNLGAAVLGCEATAILGPEARTFYVAPTAVYVWMTEDPWEPRKPGAAQAAWLYRIPVDGSPPQVAATRGIPVDQFSFQENEAATQIDVMTVAVSGGDGMWRAESVRGDVDLLRLPLSRFGDGTDPLEEDDYRRLPGLGTNWGRVQNRFVGGHLIYSTTLTHYDDEPENESVPEREGVLTVAPLDGGSVQRFMVTGEIGRIEIMGADALVVSSDEDVVFTTVALGGTRPIITDQFVMPGAEEAETRSHAFFYQPDASSPDGATGVLGLPVVRANPAEKDDQYSWRDRRGLASIAWLRRGAGRLRSVGTLDSALVPGPIDDGCVASCVDWYGDARPIFLNGRIFALLGYELVEGRERGGRIREVRRVNFTPPTPDGPRPYYQD